MSDGKSRAAGSAQHDSTSATPPAIKRMRAAIAAGVTFVALLLGVFGYSLIDSQQQAREDVEQRFEDVAQVSAALTNGLFDVSQAGTVQQATAQIGGRRIEQSRLDGLRGRGTAPYIEVFDERGRRIATSGRAPAVANVSGEVRRALDTGRAQLSDVIGSGPRAVVEWAIPFRSAGGRRIYVTTIPLTTLSGFLAGFLSRVPNFARADSEVLDSRGVLLGGSDLDARVGRPLPDAALHRALRGGTSGRYGDDGYFASARIARSPWRVAISTSESDLYDSVNGSRRTIPWLLFGAFALAALIGLTMMRRAAVNAAALQRKELSERHAVEINDNIIQGLALAAYELERGGENAGASQVAETLHEAQRLVSQLLGEGEVTAGQLRREAAARTTRPAAGEPPEGSPGGGS